MDQTRKEYVLQWSGHANSITERFSGLLARQALVDVTLICQEQKLRVHKLVLASCSLYFEEMLEQDLGQEPIILLKDLDFDILKAMVEFMYCGETTIAHCHLHSLLDAAQVFKVKDLESIVHGTMQSKNYMDNDQAPLERDFEPAIADKDCVQINFNLTHDDNSQSVSLPDEIVYKNDLGDQMEDQEDPESDETTCHIDSTNAFTAETSLEDATPTLSPSITISNDASSCLIENLAPEDPDSDCKAIFNPQSSPSSGLECDSSNLASSDSDNNSTDSQQDLFDLATGVGECLRVYTHKKRKSLDKKTPLSVSDALPLSTDCIDLSEDSACDTAPVTLPSALDMETDYTWSLSTDGIGNALGDRQSGKCDESVGKSTHRNGRHVKKLLSMDNRNISIGRRGGAPVLRRSVRLNQVDNDDSNNNGEVRKETFKSKAKRKIKYSEARGVADENSVSKKNNSKSLRSAGKSKGNRTRSLSTLRKDEKKSKATSKIRNDNLGKVESLESDIFSPIKLNTIATVDRALWGDMSDILESHENVSCLPEYSLSKEIPFAVGLLPLHAALERMQAMPDYQPRKTRSSFATPLKQDVNGGKRRINFIDSDLTSVKRHCSTAERVVDDDTCSTLCHIQIHTSSQCASSRGNIADLISVDSMSDKR